MIAELGAAQSWLIVLGLAVGSFLIRYSFIGFFANREMPLWLARSLQLMVPGIFAAIVFSGVVMVGGQVAGLTQWPRYVAAGLALIAAAATQGNMLVTVITGMVALHGLPWLMSML